MSSKRAPPAAGAARAAKPSRVRAASGAANVPRRRPAVWLMLSLALLTAGCSRFGFESSPSLQQEVQWDVAEGPAESAAADMAWKTVVVQPEAKYNGSLILINKEHPVRAAGTADDIVRLADEPDLMQGYAVMDRHIRLSRRVAQAFAAATAAAKSDGVEHFLLTSGYRDADEQRSLYEQMGEQRALPPGHSEHHLGVSLDIGSTESLMEDAPEGKWLRRNAWKFGFILRYPPDKTDMTGIRYEPWHFRYVGLPHSAIIQAGDLVLEQYLDQIKEQTTVVADVLGTRYNIRYYPVGSEPATIRVPDNRSYTISGNNVDGVIVTY